jgi:hypothetical protein
MEQTILTGKKLCACGCGHAIVPQKHHSHYNVRFIHNHHTKGKRGPLCKNWKGGRLNKNGYISIRYPSHPQADAGGYIFEHIIVYEQYYRLCILPWIIIHHMNGSKQDNRVENLLPMTNSQHHIHHVKNRRRDSKGRFRNVYSSGSSD